MENKKRKLMVIGWDAADWKVINRLIPEGKMPALQKFLSEGVSGRIKTLDPPLSPMLWTSIATGFRADKHGIKGFVEPTPEGTGLRPVTSTSRRVKAIWNILNQNGYKSNVVAWWPSNPVEPINGCMVSNLYQTSNKDHQNWEMAPGSVHPPRLEETLKKYRVHLSEITSSMVAPFVPDIEDISDESHRDMLTKVAKIMAEMSGVHAASTYLQENEPFDFMAVYHDAIDHFCHLAMKFYPPKMDHVPEVLYNKYNKIVESGYMLQDMMLDRTLQMCDEDTAVMIVSDHGFHSDHLRPKRLPKELAAPAREHNPYGIICMKGPGIKKSGEIFGASIIDITPTILAYFGLPVGKDMEGKVLDQCFDEDPNVKFIPSWERVSGDSGQHRESEMEDTWESKEAMKQLIELGYVEEIEDDKLEERMKELQLEGQYYVARNLIDGNRIPEAIEILEPIYEEAKVSRHGQRLALAYLMNKEFGKCQKLVEEIRNVSAKRIEDGVWEQEHEKVKLRFTDPELEVPNYMDFVEGMLCFNMNKPQKAIDFFNKVLENSPGSIVALLFKGRSYIKLSEWEKAKDPLIESLALNQLNPVAHFNLGLAYLRTNDFNNAVEEFLAAIELEYDDASNHYYLGEALYKLDEIEHAVGAFNTALSIQPGMSKAHKWLESIYTNDLKDHERAEVHRKFITDNIRKDIVIVSGLPRSGTSMMMQMLDAGGLEPMTDGQREADHSNPKGYYEYEKVKGLMSDNTWLDKAEGKVLKVIAQLVSFLPPNHNYKIIFMERQISEVLISQQKMLGKESDVNAKVFPTGLDQVFKKQIAKMNDWIDSQPNVEILRVNYKDVIENPIDNAHKISGFLGEELNLEAMAIAVDPELYRNKIS